LTSADVLRTTSIAAGRSFVPSAISRSRSMGAERRTRAKYSASSVAAIACET
jgi:hypothetical protein